MRGLGTLSVAAMAVGLFAGNAAHAQDSRLRVETGGWVLTANGAVSAQAGAWDDLATGRSETTGEWDASLLLNAERITDNGVTWGLRAEFDTGERAAEDLQRDEIYAYVAGAFGRFELGEQDGAADTIALHAPIVGLGQIRGDFVRYTGTAALLTPFDTRDALKIVYLSPPMAGFRLGASWAPEVESNSSDPNPRRRTRQENGVELAAAWQTPVGSDWAFGASIAWVGAEADPITQRGDIESWSIGAQASRGPLTLGAAYVSRGDSNSLVRGLDEDEWNVGAAWRDGRWSAAASASVTSSTQGDNRLLGVGGSYDLTENWVIRADVVSIREEPVGRRVRDSVVALAELSFRF
jgi:predicted porin